MSLTDAPRTRGGATRLPEPGMDVSRLRDGASRYLAHPLADVALVAVPVALLLGLGVVMVWSASSVQARYQFSDSNYFLIRELVFLVIGLVGCAVMTRVPLTWLRGKGLLFLLVSGAMMCITFVKGATVKGNRNWINFGPMLRFQPSELCKLVIILLAGTLFAGRHKALDDPRYLLIPFVPWTGCLIGLAVLQGDLGTAVLLGAIVLMLLWNVGAPLKLFAWLGAAAAAVVVVLVNAQPYRMARIFGFLDPTFDPSGINYQPNQAQYGFATGGWWGIGLGYSRMKWGYLSEAHTDYILAVIGEELGAFATLAVIVLFVTFAFGGFRIALRSSSFYGRVVAGGITAWLSFQAAMNIAMVLRLMPVVGVPLPFVSYGGSGLVVSLAAIGILVRVALEDRATERYLRRLRRARRPRGRVSAVLSARAPHLQEGTS